MKVKVVFFGMIAERLGKDSDIIDVSLFENEDNSYVEQIKHAYPELENMTFRVAVDKRLDAVITNETKEIAVLPPFAGG